jgi:hypothetical protein
MLSRTLFHRGEPLPALPSGQWAGSCRLQPLRVATREPVRWVLLCDLDEHQPIDSAAVTCEEVGLFDAPRLRLPLSELTRPWGVIHHQVASRWPEFRVVAARALIANEVPIRVVVGPDGRIERPAGLLRLRGEIPVAGLGEGHRARLNREPRHWLVHLDKHLIDENELDGMKQAVWSNRFRPLSPLLLARAARFAKRHARPEKRAGLLDGLQPEHWPLVELYSAITLTALEHALEGSGLHAARDGIASTLFEELLTLALDLRPGEEVVQAAPVKALRVVLRGEAGLTRGLLWRTTYPTAGERGGASRMEAEASKLRGRAGIATATWNLQAAPSDRGEPQRRFSGEDH